MAYTNPLLKADKLLIAPQGRKGLYETYFAPQREMGSAAKAMPP